MKFLLIGKLLKPHGLRGELGAMFYVDDLRDLKNYTRFYVRDKQAHQLVEIEKISGARDRLFVRVTGVDDRTKAEAIRGRELFVDEIEVPKIKEKDTFYIKDLFGMDVVCREETVGKISNIIEVANRTLMFILGNDGREQAVPFSEDYVEKVDVQEGKISVKNLDEFGS